LSEIVAWTMGIRVQRGRGIVAKGKFTLSVIYELRVLFCLTENPFFLLINIFS
jgi:hypothetical protein